MPDVIANLKSRFEDLKEPGDFYFSSHQRITFRCPCGCGCYLGIDYGPGGWSWDGNRDKPTITPSILHSSKDGCGWHGYLTAGVFKSC